MQDEILYRTDAIYGKVSQTQAMFIKEDISIVGRNSDETPSSAIYKWELRTDVKQKLTFWLLLILLYFFLSLEY